jgi:hypothetical protein
MAEIRGMSNDSGKTIENRNPRGGGPHKLVRRRGPRSCKKVTAEKEAGSGRGTIGLKKLKSASYVSS